MKEKYIIASGVSGTEILRSLAKQGINTIGIRVVSSLELAKIALMKSGISIEEEFLTKKEEPSLIYSFLNTVPYFAAASFADAENLASSIRTVRTLIPSDEEKVMAEKLSGGEFPDKNGAVLSVYKEYLTRCKAEKKIDMEGIIRKAVTEASHFAGDFFTLSEFPVSPLDMALADHVSGGTVSEISIKELYKKEAKDIEGLTYTESYGSINEAEGILADIYKNKLPLDSCTVACTSGAYSQLFFDLSQNYDIPVTFGSGIPISNTNPAKLLKLIYEWDDTGYNGIDSIKKILFSEAFNKGALKNLFGIAKDEKLSRFELEAVAKMCGNLRLGFDKNVNENRLNEYAPVVDEKSRPIFEKVKKLSKEFEKGCTSFLNKYVYLRTEEAERIDQSALSVITESLEAYEKYSAEASLREIVPELLAKTVCSENSKEGHLHITSITGAMATVRENLYICGLSAAEFPGRPKENYLVLDNDFLMFAGEDIAPTSARRIALRKNSLDNLLGLASSLDCKIKLSFSGYNLADNKDVNPSSVLFSIYEKEFPGKGIKEFTDSLNHYEYFDAELSRARLVGKAYSEGHSFEAHTNEIEFPTAETLLEKSWSPSALEIFFKCPRHFYLAKVLGIAEPEEDDPFSVISAADIGTLAHSMMEELAQGVMDKKMFLKKSEELFDKFLLSRPPMHESSAEKEKKDFILMMDKAYDLDPKNEVLSAEEEYSFTHETGVKLHGYPDRVEKDSSGNYIIADFKSKRKKEHNENDIDTCLQVVIYAWLCKQAGIPISRCDYRYLRLKKNISCKYNNDMEEKLTQKLTEFKEALLTNDFPRNESADSCKFCKMGSICKFQLDSKKIAGEEE